MTTSTSNFTRAFFITMVIVAGLIVAPTLIHAQDSKTQTNSDNNSTSKIEVKNITTTSVVISWHTDQPTTSLVWYKKANDMNILSLKASVNAEFEKKDGSYKTDHKIQVSGLDPNTRYIFTIGGLERDGDIVTSSETSFRTLLAEVVNPIITSFTAGSITTSKASLILTTNEPVTAQVTYNVKGSTSIKMVQSSPFATKHIMPIISLTSGTDYEAKVKITNRKGEVSESGVLSWTTRKDDIDTTNPKISNVVVRNDTSTTATLTWMTDEPTTTAVWYYTSELSRFFGIAANDMKSQAETVEFTTSHTATLTGLTPGQTYLYKVGGIDRNNNLGQSDEMSFVAKTQNPTDTIKPIIYNMMVNTRNSPRIAFIRWSTNEATTDTIVYSTSPDFTADTTKTITQARLTTNHQISIRGIERNTFYYVKVTSVDGSNNATVYDDTVFYLSR